MGVNTWTPAQWRAYNARTGDRHVGRRLPPISQTQMLAQDLEQERHLVRLERRHHQEEHVEAYRRRELRFIHSTRPLLFIHTGEDGDDDR